MKLHLPAAATAAALFAAAPASAQQVYVGEVQLNGNPACPARTAEADGAQLPSAGNPTLFRLIGTTYGGDAGNFALPDLRGRAAVGRGQAAPYLQGAAGGNETVALTVAQMAPHQHSGYLWVAAKPANVDDPTNASLATLANVAPYAAGPPTVSMAAGSIQVQSAGGGQPYDNRKPYLALRYCVVTSGIAPR